MIALSELKKLPIPERLQLVEDLWESLVEEREALPDPVELVEEIRERSRMLRSDPESGLSWEGLGARIQSRRG